MTEEEYLETQSQIMVIAGIVKGLPLREFIATAEKTDTVGPIVDPTLWIQGHDSLATILDIARSLLRFQEVIITKIDLGAIQMAKKAKSTDVDKKRKYPLGTLMAEEGRKFFYIRAGKTPTKGSSVSTSDEEKKGGL